MAATGSESYRHPTRPRARALNICRRIGWNLVSCSPSRHARFQSLVSSPWLVPDPDAVLYSPKCRAVRRSAPDSSSTDLNLAHSHSHAYFRALCRRAPSARAMAGAQHTRIHFGRLPRPALFRHTHTHTSAGFFAGGGCWVGA
jgi:hypothetical protein